MPGLPNWEAPRGRRVLLRDPRGRGLTVTRGARLFTAVPGDQRGWSKHELLHLDRAAKFLAANGTIVESDRGITDEGDPWFVLCDKPSGRSEEHTSELQSLRHL